VSAAASRWRIVLGIAWLLLALWGATALLGAAAPTSTVAKVLGPFTGVALLGFVALHSTIAYGWRGAALLAFSAFAIALALESLSIATGLPFGFFEHGDEFGAKIGAVPVVVALGYFLYGYPAWMLARLVVGRNASVGAIPLIAAFIVTGFDLTHDPIGATARGFWQFRDVSGISGVPLSNFIGWLVTSGTIFLVWNSFAGRLDRAPAQTDRAFWALPIAMWLLTALQYPLMWAAAPDSTVAAGDAILAIGDIYETATINALLVMGLVIVLATSRLLGARWEITNDTRST